MTLADRISRVKPYQYVIAAIILGLIIVSIMSLIFHGRVTYDYLITAAITALIVSSGINGLIFIYQRQLEAQNLLLAQEKSLLAELNREKNEIMGIVAHDLKNPLTIVVLNAQVVKQLAAANRLEPAALNERMDNIEQTAGHMTEIVDKLLNINAIETGKLTLTPAEINITELVSELARQYQEVAADKNITLHWQPDGSASVYADQNATREVLDNLISNAVKYSPHGKRIWLRVTASEAATRIEVQDEGPGLTEEDKSRLFEKFTRLSAAPTGGEKSTGLGLSIAQKLVQAMNGRIWCDSQFGHGATFAVELPVNNSQIHKFKN
jgi:signal transduction histidine kinase